MSAAHDLAERFLAALSAGDVPDDLLTGDFTAWTTSSQVWVEKARYQGAIRLLASVFDAGLQFRALAITAEEDRIAVEVRSHGMLVNGEVFEGAYSFHLRTRDGRIASIAEYFDPATVRAKLAPLMQAAMGKG